jgi:hypothetical protein
MNKTLHRIYVGSFVAAGLAALILLIYYGYDYYSLSLEERPFADNHNLLKPSGYLGHGLGIIGTLMMIVGVSIYMIRKRMRILFSFGYLKHWLEFHIFLCTVGPLFVLFHTAFKFGGIVSISFWSMVAVVLSGVIGRFIYLQIPRTIEGKEIDLNELYDELAIETQKKIIRDNRIQEQIEIFIASGKFLGITITNSLFLIVKDRFKVIKFLREIKRELSNDTSLSKHEIKQSVDAIKERIILGRRIELLKLMHRLFRYWHILHLPFAISMFVIMLIHVGVTILFGYKWIF